MAEERNSKIITIFLAVIILIAIIAIVYVNLPEEKTNEEDNTQDDENNDNIIPAGEEILSIIYESQEKNFTLLDLEELETYSGSGSFIKTKVLPDVIINGPYNFTGVKFSTLISQMDSLPDNYNITVTASDGWTSEFTMNQTNGEIDVYNETGDIIEYGNVTMILAYIEDDEYISDEEVGPLRIAFVGENAITESNLWSKMVETIEIIAV
jgi:hypothetical protein